MRTHTALGAIVGAAVGTAIGIGGFTFVFAQGTAYLTNDPAACANCHVMREQYDGWMKSSHHTVATCNDCHTPPGLIPKYTTKALNGFWHSFYFTTGGFREPIRIGQRNREVTEKACRHCHGQIVESIEAPHANSAEIECLTCHNSVGHPEGLGRESFTASRRTHE